MTPTESTPPPTGEPDAFALAVGDPVGGVVTVTVRGDVDMVTAPKVDAEIARALRVHPTLADLSGVTFLGSAGLSILMRSQRAASEAGTRFAIVADNHAVLRAIEVTGLDEILHLFPDSAAATSYLAP